MMTVRLESLMRLWDFQVKLLGFPSSELQQYQGNQKAKQMDFWA
ncbi:hypothetical protein CsSME_00036620 [Camellia sinensis var. sinensis]